MKQQNSFKPSNKNINYQGFKKQPSSRKQSVENGNKKENE